MMTITYLENYGYLIEAVNCTILLDYVKGKLPDMRTDKPIYVLASSRDPNHYNERIFRLYDQYDDVYYFLSSDIEGGNRIPKQRQKLVTFIHPDEDFILARFHLHAMPTSALGVAFSFDVSTFSVLHAGSLADAFDPTDDGKHTHRQFMKALEKLEQDYDIAFLPANPALGAHMATSAREIVDGRRIGKIFPMGFQDDWAVPGQFSEALGREVELVHKRGQVWEV